MVQEVRSILFSPEECHQAVSALLVVRVRGLRPEQLVGLALEQSGASVRATLRIATRVETSHVLSPEDLLSAVLLFCRKARIPLSSRSHKRLTLIAGSLALTTSINLRATARSIDGGTVVQGFGGPDLAMMHTV